MATRRHGLFCAAFLGQFKFALLVLAFLAGRKGSGFWSSFGRFVSSFRSVCVGCVDHDEDEYDP